jgi:glucan-binding YG repeat protein
MRKKYWRNLYIFASAVFITFGFKYAALSIEAETVQSNSNAAEVEQTEDVVQTEESAQIATEEQTNEIQSNVVDENTNNTAAEQDTALTSSAEDQSIQQSTNSVVQNGWSSDYQKYYIDGTAVTGFKTIDGNDYYFNDEGIKTIGQKHIGENWYCFLKDQTDPVMNGKMVKKQFFDLFGSYHASWDKDKTAYYDENGHMLYKQQHLGNFWYCFNQYSGAMITGFFNLNSDYHASWDKDKIAYYDQSGHMLYKQQHLGNFWYCFNQYSGAMITGFFNLNSDYHASWDKDKTAYYDKNGHMLYGRQYINGSYYYFNVYSGAMATNSYISGHLYGSDGKEDTNSLDVSLAKLLSSAGWTLRKGYDKVVDYLTYQTMYSYSASWGSDWFAQYGLNNRVGNCYVYAAMMYKFGKLMGYDIHQVSGHHLVSSGAKIEHSWCEVVLNGTTYIIDPDFKEELNKDCYLKQYGESGTLKITDHYRMN